MTAYLDNSATTKPCPEAVQACMDALTVHWGNPSSVHSLGLEAERLLVQARSGVAGALGAEPDRIFFTSGGTEADNWAIFSAAQRLGKRGRHIVTTQVEHHAVLHPMKRLEELGFQVSYLKPDQTGFISTETLRAALRPDTILVSIMMVNNETGAVMPIGEMVRAVRQACPLALFHTDAVQGFLKVPFKAKTLGADLISISGHKVHAMKGAGALYIRPGLTLPPYLYGGGQESGYRSGTEAMPAILSFGAACRAQGAKVKEAACHMQALLGECRQRLSEIDGLVFLGRADAPHILNVSLPGLRSQGIINCLQQDGVYVSAGSACSKGHRSHVLQAMGLSPAVIDGAIRISVCYDTTSQELELLQNALKRAVLTLKG